MIEVQVYRYNPETDNAPGMASFQVDEAFGRGMVLDVLEHLHGRDSTLAYRRSCREGVCGSDGMCINGKNALACVTRVAEATAGRGPLVIRPLPGMPVIRDLVVDQKHFFEQYARIKSTTSRPPPSSAARPPRNGSVWTGSTNVFSAVAVRRAAPPGGGIRTSTWGPPCCCRPSVFWRTAGTPPPGSGWRPWTTTSALCAAGISKTAPMSAPRDSIP